MAMTPHLTTEQAAKTVEQNANSNRVTKESIEARIASVNYRYLDHLTICIIVMTNGFMVVGKAAPADPSNYNPDVGKRYAYDDAFKQLWHFEGYLMCERLHQVSAAVQASGDIASAPNPW